MKKKEIIFISLIVALLAVSCSDENTIDGNANKTGESVPMLFDVLQVQQPSQSHNASVANVVTTDFPLVRGVSSTDLKPQCLKAMAPDGADVCFEETTVEGVNPMNDTERALTRGAVKTAIDADFSLHACKGSSTTPSIFYNVKVRADGTLYEPKYWSKSDPTRRFYAFYPYVGNTDSDMKLSSATYTGNPFVDFIVNTNVMEQKDFMYAVTKDITYAGGGIAPSVPLVFHHVLTAVKFAVGENLSYNWTITKIEILNAYSKARYIVESTTGKWSEQEERKNFVLDNLNFNTKVAYNTAITNNDQTFLMIPQKLEGNNVKVRMTLKTTDGKLKRVTTTLTGEWEENTTKTYTLSNNLSSNWEWEIKVAPPAAAEYTATQTGIYTVTSYRKAPSSFEEPVAWEVVGYDSNDDGEYNINEKPTWFKSLTKTSGDGGTAADTGVANIDATNDIDKTDDRATAIRNASLKNSANARGTEDKPWDLSKWDMTNKKEIKTTTANCYVISGAGWYKFPIVFGNAIKNGGDNKYAYKTDNTGKHILKNFKDYAGEDIMQPYIALNNYKGQLNTPSSVEVLWSDQKGMVTNLTIEGVKETPNNGSDDYIKFYVPIDKIQQGNVVIAIRNAQWNQVVWSWHLWFAPADVLDRYQINTRSGKNYFVSKVPLGTVYSKWGATKYTSARSLKVKIRQKAGPKKEAVFTITQNPGNDKEVYTTYYQFGRKDALLPNEMIKEGETKFSNWPNGHSLGESIKYANIMFTMHSSETQPMWENWCNEVWWNIWSVNTTGTGYGDEPIVKSVYDPSPMHYKLPVSQMFTSFSPDGNKGTPEADLKMWQNGYFFNMTPTTRRFFPAAGWMDLHDGKLKDNGTEGCYWTARYAHSANSIGCYFDFKKDYAAPKASSRMAHGLSIMPMWDD